MISSVVGQILGVNEQISVWSLIALLPIFVWELSLGLWLVFKGFRRNAPILADILDGASGPGEGVVPESRRRAEATASA